MGKSKYLRGLGLGLALLISGCATPHPTLPLLPPPPMHANGGTLWTIISTQCVPGQLQHNDPKPCALVSLDGGLRRGFVLLKDRQGVAQHLLMPADKITGIEDPQLLAPDRPNYFAEAWKARRFVEERLGHPLAREDVSVAVNSIYGRSQDQLHLHVDCLASGVRDALKADAPQIGASWSDRSFNLNGHPYRIRRLPAAALERTDPFRLLARDVPDAAANMGAWTLVLVGETTGGAPGFYLITTRADPAHGERASGEDLQDHACAGLTAPPAVR